MLTALGFVPTAKHRRKAVTRWQQGDINIVMNCEPEGLAHSFDAVHGASVCALGLSVDERAGRARRAPSSSRSRASRRPSGPDELKIPSVKGVGGSLIYFIEDGSAGGRLAARVHASRADRRSSRARCGCERIDHIAQTMQYEEFLSWLLYYVALFNVAKTPQIEIADTLGSCRARPSSRRIARCASR